MTEELPLTPDVRATQTDALNALGLHWACDYEHCPNPGAGGGKATCCDGTLVLCQHHMARYYTLLTHASHPRQPTPDVVAVHALRPHLHLAEHHTIRLLPVRLPTRQGR